MPRHVQLMKVGDYREHLKLVDLPPLDPGPKQAVVQVLSTGVALGEIIVISGNHARIPPVPCTVGGDLCGRVTRVGPDCALGPGSLVFGRAAGKMSTNLVGDPVAYGGGLAEEAIVNAEDVHVAPEGLDPHVLAGFQGNYSSTYHALKDIGELQPGERLCVLGAAGGCGIAAIELGKAIGASVVACASSAEKLAACKEAGADVLIDYSLPGFKDRIRKEAGGPLDVVFDPVGGEYAEPALRALGFGGRFLVFGFAAGGTTPKDAIPAIPLNLALLNERKILGAFNAPFTPQQIEADRRNMAELTGMMVSGKLRPRPPTVLPLERFLEAFDIVAKRQAIGKICISSFAPNAKL